MRNRDLPRDRAVDRFLELGRALADGSRVKALLALAGGELCLCQVVDLLGLAPSTVSKHLNQLLAAGLVERRKVGRWHFFRLAGADADPAAAGALAWLRACLAEGAAAAALSHQACCVRERDLAEVAEVYA